jgi:hypothetical protein
MMQFPHGELVERGRRPLVDDPYNPERQVPGEWADAETIELEEAFVASSSAAAVPDATRSQILGSKSLYLTDVDADVKVGDRIRAGSRTYYVNSIPEADVNPFTGWQPAQEIPLDLTLG